MGDGAAEVKLRGAAWANEAQKQQAATRKAKAKESSNLDMKFVVPVCRCTITT